jgi:uncharacterized membrane protein
MRKPLAIIAVLFAIALVRSASVFERLPRQMMSHFDGHGQPNGAMSRGTFFAMFGLVGAGTVLVLLFIPWLTRAVPPSLINIPNREYWLAPERRAQVGEKIGAFGAWSAVVTALLLVVVLELVLRANLARAPLETVPMWLALGAYLLAAFGSIVWLLRAFRIPDGHS